MADDRRRGMNIRLRAACVGCLAFLALEIAPGALPGAPEQWSKWSPIANAGAYQVKQLCEDKVSKRGPWKKCRSVLVQPEAVIKKESAAGDSKDAKSKDPHSAGVAAH